MAGTPTENSSSENSGPAAQATRSVCHRIKNDLQTILNLLILAQAEAHSPDDLSLAMQKRITVVGSAYAMIADSGEAPSLDSLTKEIARRCASRHGVELRLLSTPPEIDLSLRLCTPFALWIGEIVDNSVSHIPSDIEVHLDITGGQNSDEVWLQILDNGPGLPPNFKAKTDFGLGLRLAEAIAKRDLSGNMYLGSTPQGLMAKLVVPVNEFTRLNSD